VTQRSLDAEVGVIDDPVVSADPAQPIAIVEHVQQAAFAVLDDRRDTFSAIDVFDAGDRDALRLYRRIAGPEPEFERLALFVFTSTDDQVAVQLPVVSESSDSALVEIEIPRLGRK